MRFALLLSSLLLSFLASGCGEQTDTVTSPASLAPTATVQTSQRLGPNGVFNLVLDDGKQGVGPRPLQITGTVAPGIPVQDAVVELLREGQERLVRVTLADGTELLTDVDFPAGDVAAATGQPEPPVQASANPPWLWVTPVSHLATSYRRQTGASRAEAVRRVKTLLGISARQFVNRPWSDEPDSRFSPAAFLREARRVGGVQALTAQLLAEAEAGQLHGFRSAAASGVLAKDELVASDGPATAASKGFLGTLLDNTVADCAASILLKSVGWIIGKCGKSSSTTEELTEIISLLEQVQSQIAGLSKQIDQSAVATLQADLNTAAINPVTSYTNQEKVNLTNAPSSGYVPFSPRSSTSFLENGGLTTSLQTNVALTYAEDIIQDSLCLGATATGNLFTAYNANQGNAFGSNAGADGLHPESFYYDFRNDALVTPAIVSYGRSMLGYVAQAANMLAESQHLSLNGLTGVPPAGNITSCQTYLNGYRATQSTTGALGDNGLMALSKLMVQQLPLAYLGGESPLPSPGLWAGIYQDETQNGRGNFNGTLWTATGHEFNGDGKDTGVSLDIVTAYNTNGYYGWLIPAPDEVTQLFSNAIQCYSADNPTGTASTNDQIAYGLQKMGLLSSNYQSGATVMVYCNLTPNYGEPAESENAINLQVYSTANYTPASGGASATGSPGGNGYFYTGTAFDFRYQGAGNDALVLLVRPLPGEPQGSTYGSSGTQNASGQASTSTSGVPQAVLNSSLYTANAYLWNTDLMLACNYPPSGLVVEQDPANPFQMRAYALWSCQTIDDEIGVYQLNLGASQDGVSSGSYLAWTEVTDYVEWLSSNTSLLEVSNNLGTSQTVLGGTVTGASSVPSVGQTIVENPVLNGNQLTGGTLLVAPLNGTLTGSTTQQQPFSGSFAGLVLGGNLTGGTVSGGSNYTIPNGTSNTTILKGCQLANASLQPRATAFAQSTPAGQLRPHNPANASSTQATVTAVWLTQAAGLPPINLQTNQQQQLTATLSVNASSLGPAPRLVALEISPDNLVINRQTPTSQTFYLTGYYSDGTCQDLSKASGTTWRASIPAAINGTVNLGPSAGNTVAFSTDSGTPNQLNVQNNSYQGDVLIRASFGDLKTLALINVSPP